MLNKRIGNSTNGRSFFKKKKLGKNFVLRPASW